MSAPKENGPGAAATAHRAGIVACGKPTCPYNADPEDRQSRSVAENMVSPDNTGGKQALRRSLREAVNAKCKSCIYDPFGGCGTWREQVQACPSANCPLHPVRPMSVKAQNTGLHALGTAPSVPGASMVPDALLSAGLGLNRQTATDRKAA